MATSLPAGTDDLAMFPQPMREHARDKTELGGSDNISSSPGTTSVPTAHQTLDADAGAMGLVGPVTGAQEMPNAAHPGSI